MPQALQSTYAPPPPPARYVRDRVRAKKTVRCQCPAGVEADRRSADLPRWQTGGFHGPDRRRGGQQEARAGLDGAAGWRPAAADHAGWREQSTATLVARFQAHRLPLRPWRDRVRAKKTVRCQCPAGVEADRRSADLPRWQTRGYHGPDRRRGGQQEARM